MASNTTTTTTDPADLSSLAGPLLLGYMFNWGLYGMLVVQVYIYHQAFKGDKLSTRILVYSLFVLETVQTIIATNDAFNTYARNFGDPGIILQIQFIWLSIPVLTGIISVIVQIYYSYRIYVLSGSKCLAAVIIAVSLLQGASALGSGIQARQAVVFTLLEKKAHTTTTMWHVGSAICDVLITASMIFFLTKRDTGMDVTRRIIFRLVHLIVETGLINATAAVIDIILFLTHPQKLYFMCAALVLTKLYSNSLLVLFNSRVKLASWKDQSRSGSTSNPSYIAYAGNSRGARVRAVGGANELRDGSGRTRVVRVHKETVTWSDANDDVHPLDDILNKDKSLCSTDNDMDNDSSGIAV